MTHPDGHPSQWHPQGWSQSSGPLGKHSPEPMGNFGTKPSMATPQLSHVSLAHDPVPPAPLQVAVQMTQEAFDRDKAAFLQQHPTKTHLALTTKPLKTLLAKTPVAAPKAPPTTGHLLFQRSQFHDYVAQHFSALLPTSIGIVAGGVKKLLKKDEPAYPEPKSQEKAPDRPLPLPDPTQGRDLLELHYERYPYNAHNIPTTFKESPFITYEQMTYAHYTNITGEKFLVTVRTELPITPTPSSFFQPRFFFMPPLVNGAAPSVQTGPLINLILDWRDPSAPTSVEEFPIPLHEIMRVCSPWPVPTVTQIVDLTTKLVAEVDWLSQSLYFTPSLHSIYITNPSCIGTEKPLTFKLCPFSLGMREELPPGVHRNTYMRRCISMVLLELTLWIVDCMRLDFHYMIPDAYMAAPGMLSAFHEVWREASPNFKSRLLFDDNGVAVGVLDDSNGLITESSFSSSAAAAASSSSSDRGRSQSLGLPKKPLSFLERLHDKLFNMLKNPEEFKGAPTSTITLHSSNPPSSLDATIQSLSPTIATFNHVRSRTPREYTLDNVPGLIQAMACFHSNTINTVATDGLYFFLKKQQPATQAMGKRLFLQLLSMATLGTGAVVPLKKTGLVDPSSVSKSIHWIHRMFCLFIILQENERYGDYSKLRRIQQINLTAGIGSQLGGNLAGYSGKFALSVLVPVVCVSVLSSFQFPILRVRLIFDRNVRKMATMLYDAKTKKDSSKIDVPSIDTECLISMMMAMSDCATWCNMEERPGGLTESDDQKWAKIWHELDDTTFLLNILPCWTPSTSDQTTAEMVKRLETIADRNVENLRTCPASQAEEMRLKLHYIFDWCTHFAWNSSEQVTNGTYQSLYTSYFLSMVFRRPMQTIFEQNQNYAIEASEEKNRTLAISASTSSSSSSHLQKQLTEPTSLDVPRHHTTIAPSVTVPSTSSIAGTVTGGSSGGSSMNPSMHYVPSMTGYASSTGSGSLGGSSSSSSQGSGASSSSSSTASDYYGPPRAQSANWPPGESMAQARSRYPFSPSGPSLAADFSASSSSSASHSLNTHGTVYSQSSYSPPSSTLSPYQSYSYSASVPAAYGAPSHVPRQVVSSSAMAGEAFISSSPPLETTPITMNPGPGIAPSHASASPNTASALYGDPKMIQRSSQMQGVIETAQGPSRELRGSHGPRAEYSAHSEDPSKSRSTPASPPPVSATDEVYVRKRPYPFFHGDDPSDPRTPRSTKLLDPLVNTLLTDIMSFDTHNPKDLGVIMRTYKAAISPHNIIHFVKNHQDPHNSKLYVAMAEKNGAPEGDSDCYFSLPTNQQHIVYHTPTQTAPVMVPQGISAAQVGPLEGRHSSVRSILESEMSKLYPGEENVRDKFKPTTLAAFNLPLCEVRTPEIGTTGMMEIRLVDSGDTNDVVVGISWDLFNEGIPHPADPGAWFKKMELASIIPGFTPTSLGLSSTGALYYIDSKTGQQVITPYTMPFGTSSRIAIGIAYDRVYFIVDSVFYPPIPGFYLPNRAQIHGLVRFGCLGIKITMRHLASKWSLARNSDGSLIYAQTNPLAHAIYLSELRTKVCPHYHAHRRPHTCRPKLEKFKNMVQTELVTLLGKQIAQNIRLCHLANQECASESCLAPHEIRAVITGITSAPVVTTDP